MKCLVTGASGFVGAAVARKLIEAGHDVRVLMRRSSSRANIEGLDCGVVQGDLTDPASLKRAVEGCDAAFHVAADYRLWVKDPAVMYRANVDGTRDLLRAAAEAGVSRIVYTSSVATLGLLPGGAAADETTPSTVGDMISHYKRSKFLAEEEARRLVREEGVPAVIVNPAAPFGPRDAKPTPTGAIVVQAASGKMPAYVDTGLNVVHVDDVAQGHLLAYAHGRIGERYILGGENMSLKQILEVICGHVGRKPPRIKLPTAPLIPVAFIAETIVRLKGSGEPLLTVDSVRMAKKLMYFKIDKARAELGYDPRPAALALTDAVDWYRDAGYL